MNFPIKTTGHVEHGFKRGGKLLGCPTANLSTSETKEVIKDLTCGVYYGWAVLRNKTYKSVTNIGWNPSFGVNTEKIIECHLLEKFDEDFYGEEISLTLLGFIRSEKKFENINELKSQIQSDIQTTIQKLGEDEKNNLENI